MNRGKNTSYSVMLSGFREKVKKIEYLKYTLNSLVYWDKITYMPADGIHYRGQVMGFLAEELYKLLSDDELKRYLSYFEGNKKNDSIADGMVKRIKRNSSYVNKIPEKEYARYITLLAEAEQVWEKAREQNDFQRFVPYLEKIVAHFKSFAEYWGYKDTPYDGILGYYGEGLSVKELDSLSGELRDCIIELLRKMGKSEAPKNQPIRISMGIDKQHTLSKKLLEVIGFDFKKGRLDMGAHPTTLASSPDDVRLVTAYSQEDVRTGIFNTLHEAGKGLYEQNIDKELLGTLLAEVASFGIEEASGRFYENIIGKSRGFTDLVWELINELEPQPEGLTAEGFYNQINDVEPSLIRIDADELTYTLHIIIRYELEKELINGNLSVKDLPEAWNEKYSKYMGIEPKDYKSGVLQDIQWAAGYFGFFPSYFLANIFAAQLKTLMEKDLGSLDELIQNRQFSQINGWMTEKLYRHGAVYDPSNIIKKITGQGLSSAHYISYLEEKFKL